MQQGTAEKQETERRFAIGFETEGGYFAGIITINGQKFGIVVSPKEGDIADQQWGPWKNRDAIEGANSFFDGQANTQAMAEAGSELAKAIQALNINGHTDWYLPARRELSLLYANVPDLFDKVWHWSSTQFSAYSAWSQDFADGAQGFVHKDNALRARAVRRFISHSTL